MKLYNVRMLDDYLELLEELYKQGITWPDGINYTTRYAEWNWQRDLYSTVVCVTDDNYITVANERYFNEIFPEVKIEQYVPKEVLELYYVETVEDFDSLMEELQERKLVWANSYELPTKRELSDKAKAGAYIADNGKYICKKTLWWCEARHPGVEIKNYKK